MSEVASPCVRNCCLNGDDVCLGCFRHIDEIVGWHSASDQQKRQIVELADSRKVDHQRQYGINWPLE